MFYNVLFKYKNNTTFLWYCQMRAPAVGLLRPALAGLRTAKGFEPVKLLWLIFFQLSIYF